MKKSRDLLTTVVLIPALIGTQLPVAAAPIAGGIVVAQAKTPAEEELLRQKQHPPGAPAAPHPAQQRPGPVQMPPPAQVRPPAPPAPVQVRPVQQPPVQVRPPVQQAPAPVQVRPPVQQAPAPAQVRPPVQQAPAPAQVRPPVQQPPAQVRPPVQMQPAPAQVRPPVQPAPAQVRPPVQTQPPVQVRPPQPAAPVAPTTPGLAPIGGGAPAVTPRPQAPAPAAVVPARPIVQPGAAPQAPIQPPAGLAPVGARPAGAPPQGVGAPAPAPAVGTPAPAVGAPAPAVGTPAPAVVPPPVGAPVPGGVAPVGAHPAGPTSGVPGIAPVGTAVPPVAPPTAVPVPPPGAGRPGQPPNPGGIPQGAQAPQPGQPMPPPGAPGRPPERRGGLSPIGAAAIGVGAGLVGGFLLSGGAKGLGEVQGRRERVESGGVTYIREPGRTIVEDEGRVFVRHDETGRFRDLGLPSRTEDLGDRLVTTWDRPDGSRLVTVTDREGRLLKRIRILPDGRQIVLIDNDFRPRPQRWRDEVVLLPPLPLQDDRYIVDAGRADTRLVYETLAAPPVVRLERRYSLDEVRSSQSLRARMRSVDLDTITFETGSWEVTPDQARQLAGIADAIRRAIEANPQEVFLIEGHTDRVGNDIDNLSLSDRRAEAVAGVLTRDFAIPPENLTTQGYGEQYPKVDVEGPSRENRRVTIRRITPLIGDPQAAR
jgi:outer membrane protein OmpA-like peptidoglycan-associated protein